MADAVSAERLAFCLDSQHLFASGYPVHEEGGIDGALAEFDEVLGWTGCAART